MRKPTPSPASYRAGVIPFSDEKQSHFKGTEMSKLKLACALLALIIALWSATAIIAVEINLAVAVICIAIAIALLNKLCGVNARRGPRSQENFA
jgi:hypothetical protein